MRKLVAVLAVFACGTAFAVEPNLSVTPAASTATAASGGEVAGSNLDRQLAQVISIDYKDAEIANVLRSFAWTYGINIVTASDVQGKVTINLNNITVGEALNAVLSVNGLVYTRKGEVIYISTGDKETVDNVSEVIRLKYMAASAAQNLLKSAVSSKGDIKISEIDNSLIVTDLPDNILKVKALINKIDLPPQQVLIEAKIVDITSSDLRAMGVTWDFDYNPVGSKAGLFNRRTLADERLKSSVSMAEQSSSLSGGQIVLNTLTLKGITITGTLDALIRDGKAHLLASPSIGVLNGQEARIVIGERFPYKERTQTTSGTTETTRFVDIGTTLRVRAFVNDDGYITLNVHPEVSSLNQALDAGPRITTREADTTVRIKEGDTLVIGGLINQKDNRSSDRVPVLGDLPLIGLLFSRNETDAEQKELAVFITTRLLRSQGELRLEGKKGDALDGYTLLEKTASLSAVDKIMSKAELLDANYGLEATRKEKPFRQEQALSLYENVYEQFPLSDRAPEAMFRAARIHQEQKDYAPALELYAQVITDYPESDYVTKARREYDWIQKKMKKRK